MGTKLETITRVVRRCAQYAAPGSESVMWQDYVEDCRRVLGCAPWSEPSLEVPEDFAAYWQERAGGEE